MSHAPANGFDIYYLIEVHLYEFQWLLAPLTEFRGHGNVAWIIIITWQFSHKHNNTTLESTLVKRKLRNHERDS